MTKFPRQDSTTDQVEAVADALEETFPTAARLVREDDVPSMTEDQFQAACRFAIHMGCYDADDWLKGRRRYGK